MPRKLAFYLLTLTLLWPAAQNWSAAQAPAQQPQAKDAQEAELFNSILKETDAKKKLALLDQWKQKYPDTAFKHARLTFYMQAYQQAGQLPKAVETANELLTLDPDDLGALFAIASLTPLLGNVDPKLATDSKVLSDGEKAANRLLQDVDKLFAPAKKPQNVGDDAWAQAKTAAPIVAHQTLGWVAKQQKKNDVAEQEFIKTLELSPTAAQVSFWLGEAVIAQRNPDKYPLALYSFARAAAYNGPGALTPAGRQQVDAYLSNIYKKYHGDESGLAELKALAAKQPLPPPDLKIKSADEVRAEKEEELRKTNPLLAVFLAIKDGLTGSESQKFWEDMKGKAMPKMRGTVVSAKPAVRPKMVELAMSQSKTAEITLTAPQTSARCKLDQGAVIEFKDAEAKDYAATPFMLKLDGGEIISGCAEAPPPAKKGPAKKSAPKKK